jgi:hypothetical protein
MSLAAYALRKLTACSLSVLAWLVKQLAYFFIQTTFANTCSHGLSHLPEIIIATHRN